SGGTGGLFFRSFLRHQLCWGSRVSPGVARGCGFGGREFAQLSLLWRGGCPGWVGVVLRVRHFRKAGEHDGLPARSQSIAARSGCRHRRWNRLLADCRPQRGAMAGTALRLAPFSPAERGLQTVVAPKQLAIGSDNVRRAEYAQLLSFLGTRAKF